MFSLLGISHFFCEQRQEFSKLPHRAQQPETKYPYPSARHGYRYHSGEWLVLSADGKRLYGRGTEKEARHLAEMLSRNADRLEGRRRHVEANRNSILAFVERVAKEGAQ